MPIQGSVWGENYSAFEIRPQVKWYVNESSGSELYLATEIFYRKIKDRLHSKIYSQVNEEEYIFYEEADILKEKFGIQLMIGNKSFLTPHVFVEYYLGLGVGLRNHIYSNVVNPIPTEPPHAEWFPFEYNYAGKKWVGQYPLGLKIGYLIKK